MKKFKAVCPLCHGSGEIVARQYPHEIRVKARKLYAQGMSLRAIARELGIDVNPQKVKSLIMARTL